MIAIYKYIRNVKVGFVLTIMIVLIHFIIMLYISKEYDKEGKKQKQIKKGKRNF